MTWQLANAKIWDGSQWVAAVGGSTLSYPNLVDSSALVNVAASSTIHTKGAWIELVASTSAAANWLQIVTNNNSVGTDTSSLIDIGLGAAGSETVLISNATAGYTTTGAVNLLSSLLLPISIPAGSRIAARSQSIISSRNVPVSVATLSDGLTSPSSIDTLGAVTASSRGTNLPSNNIYVQIVGSTSREYQAILMMPTGGGSSTIATESSTYILGIGASGSEVALDDRVFGSNSAEIIGWSALGTVPLWWGNVPAGSRLAVRQSVGRGYRDVILYGVPA